MTKSDAPAKPMSLSRRLTDLRAGIALLTRLPLPPPGHFPNPPAVWAWPVVGILAGAISLGAGIVALQAGLPPLFAAAILVATTIVITGALHEDGLADCCDGFWGGWDTERRLAIMKDSHIGSYGTLALVLSVTMRIAAVAPLLEAGAWAPVVAAAALSRAPMAMIMAALPNARSAGLSQSIGRPSRAAAALACGLAAGAAVALCGPAGLALMLAATVAALGVAAIARRKIGGQTGDVLGASQQIAEIATLACACALM